MRFLTLILAIVFVVPLSATADPAVYLGDEASAVERHAAYALQAHLHALTGEVLPVQVTARLAPDASGFALGTRSSLPLLHDVWPFGLAAPADDGYLLVSQGTGKAPLVVVASQEPIGVRHGVMDLLERLGAGLFIHDVVYPRERRPVARLLPDDLAVSASPAIAHRGLGVQFSHLMGAAAWDDADYRAYIDGLARLRMNQFVVFATDDTPFAAYPSDAGWAGGRRLPSLDRPEWNRPSMDLNDFLGASGASFVGPTFGPPSAAEPDDGKAMADDQARLARTMAYAAQRGFDTVIAIEVSGNPTDEMVQDHLSKRLAHIAATYPMIKAIWLLGPSGAINACVSNAPNRGLWRSSARQWEDAFGDEQALAGAQLALFGWQARQELADKLPDCAIAIGRLEGIPTALAEGLAAVLPDGVTVLDGHAIAPLEKDGDLWMPQPALDDAAAAVHAVVQANGSTLVATHWRIKETTNSLGYLASLAWNPALEQDVFIRDRAKRFFPVAGEDAAPWLERLADLGDRWVGGTGQQEKYPFTWPVGADDERGRLAQVALELRQRIGEKSYLDMILPEDVLRGWLPERIPGISGALELTLRPTRALFGAARTPDPLALRGLYDRVAYVIALDYATSRLAQGPAPLTNGGTETVPDWLLRSRLPLALRAYERGLSTKGELGVIASINARAWGAIIDEYGLRYDTIAQLHSAVPSNPDNPVFHVLPGLVIVPGLTGTDEATVTLRLRAVGDSTFESIPLEPVGPNGFAIAFPDSFDVHEAWEYGIEATVGGAKLVWPDGFPGRWNVAMRSPGTAAMAPAAPPAARRELKINSDVDSNRHSVRLSWDVLPGERYAVSRDGEHLGTTFTGAFEDMEAPGGKRVAYEVRAQQIVTGAEVGTSVAIDTPTFPDPVAPRDIQVTSRGGQLVLSWRCNAPRADRYLVEQLDEDLAVVSSTQLDAALDRQLSVSFPARAGANTFRIHAVAPDGSIAPDSRRFGVRPIDDDAPSALQLDSKAPNVMEMIQALTQQGYTIGGPGNPLPPGAALWDRENPFTLNLWTKLRSTGGIPFLVCRGALPTPDFALYVQDGTLHAALSGLGTVCGGQPALDEWHMISVVYGRGQLDIFLDGARAGSATESDAADISFAHLADEHVPFPALETRGLIDRLTLFNASLTPQELAVLYDAGPPADE